MDRSDTPATRPTASDVVAWSAVGLSSLAVVGVAIAGITGVSTEAAQPYAMTAAAACLVASCGFATIRQIRASRSAAERAGAYDVAFASEVAARERLSFARHAASLMTSLPEREGMCAVLDESLERFGAEAAALVGDDLVMSTVRGVARADAQPSVLKVALETVRAGRAVANEIDEDNSHTLTIPLRIRGKVNDVIVLWRRSGPFSPDDLDGLSLVARIVELAMENRTLLGDVRNQLSGTLHMMIDLVEQRLPEYGAHSQRVAAYAAAVGGTMGLAEDEIDDLRTAAMLHDVGMLTVPESVLNTPRRLTDDEMAVLRSHPEHGAELTRVANFGTRIQDAIMSHHERVDGKGYPGGLAGDAIPLASRILSVCDAFVALISDRPHRARVSADEAVEALRESAGTHYDPAVVQAFVIAKAEMDAGDVLEPPAVLGAQS